MIKYYTTEGQVYYETEGEKTMNKEQKIQELTKRIEKSQAEIDELKEELEEVNFLTQYIDAIDEFIKLYNEKPQRITIKNGYYSILIKSGQEHEIINALEKIKSNAIEQLKELGVEV